MYLGPRRLSRTLLGGIMAVSIVVQLIFGSLQLICPHPYCRMVPRLDVLRLSCTYSSYAAISSGLISNIS